MKSSRAGPLRVARTARRTLLGALLGSLSTGAIAQLATSGKLLRLPNLAAAQRNEASVRWAVESADSDDASEEAINRLEARAANVEFRFNTAAAVGKPVRILLSLPALLKGLRATTNARLEWRSHGVFRAGSVRPGDKVVVFDGVLTQATLSERFDWLLRYDARDVDGRVEFEPVFELEIK